MIASNELVFALLMLAGGCFTLAAIGIIADAAAWVIERQKKTAREPSRRGQHKNSIAIVHPKEANVK